ncbi:MAG: PAS domain-containing protein, partial [Beijerinckiaceae bacterium]
MDSARTEAFQQAGKRLDSLSEQLIYRLAYSERSSGMIAEQDVLNAIATAEVIADGRKAYISDEQGALMAHIPLLEKRPAHVRELLGTKSDFAMLADGAGVFVIQIAGGEALARIRNLRHRAGQLIMIQSLADANARSNAIIKTFATLLGVATGLALCFALFVLAQARRADSAEEICEQFYARVDTALDSGRGGLWDWDIVRGRIHWSHSLYRMLGVTPRTGFLSVADMQAMMHPDDEPLMALAHRIADKSQTHVDHEFRLKSVSGHWLGMRATARVAHREDGRFPHLVGIAVDISDQKNLAASRARSDEQLRDAIEQISEAFVLWDADNRLVLSNSKFRQLHGLSSEQVHAGMLYNQVMTTASTPAVNVMREIIPIDCDNARTIETELVDGRWLQINERRTRDGGFVSVGADITSIKRHEEDLI